MIELQFEISFSGMQIKKDFSFSNISEVFRNIKISPISAKKFLLIVKKDSTRPSEVSLEEAKEEVNELADRLTLLPAHVVHDLTYIGYKDKEGQFFKAKKDFKAGSIDLSFSMDPNKFYGQDEYKRLLTKKINKNIVRTYRNALTINDSITQFLIIMVYWKF